MLSTERIHFNCACSLPIALFRVMVSDKDGNRVSVDVEARTTYEAEKKAIKDVSEDLSFWKIEEMTAEAVLLGFE